MQHNSFFHPSTIIDDGAQIGENTKIWHFCHIMNTAIIGNFCNIGQNVYIDKNVKIGNGVKIQNNVSVYANVTIEDDCFLGPSMVFTNVINPRAFIERKSEFLETTVKKGCSIGANATIVCGVTLGQYSFIGAGAVITKNVPDYALMVGVPAKQIGWVSKNGHKLEFDSEGFALCPSTNEKYFLNQHTVSLVNS
jgi:UDP-2-acetamido-3-amino-2,3-dideoxy-glucuronate N-acetyltransferase